MRSEAANVIQLLREIERRIELRLEGLPQIRVAVGEYLYNRCKDAVSEYSTANADVSIRLEMISSRADAYRALRLGDIDILLVSSFGTSADKPRISAQTVMKIYRSAAKGAAASSRLILPILDPQEAQEFMSVFREMGVRNTGNAMTIPNYYSIKSMCIAGHGQALLFEEDTQADVAAGRLVQAVPGSITVTRGCHFFGESPMLEKLARFLVASMG